MKTEAKDSPGVVAPPPLIFLSGLLMSGIVNWLYPFHILPSGYIGILRVCGGLFIVFGLATIFVVRAKMRRAKTNIEPWKPTNAIISDGIYSFSRNPVYVAMILIFLGTTLLFNSVWFVPFLILVLLIMHYGVILREEAYLEKKFGEEYLIYRTKVKRWV